MNENQPREGHTFFIPVMGTGFTIDSPLKVARYGITSVVSLVDDRFIEQVRRYHCQRAGEPYTPIGIAEEDARARRITAYLDLLDRLVARDTDALRASPFVEGSEITRYFRLLPDSPLKREHAAMLAEKDPARRAARQERLREKVAPGRIDVNIMTKLDRDHYRDGKPLPTGTSDALSALRGFANSTVRSALVFSAGLNPRLYSYAAAFPGFFPDAEGRIAKQIILKVSDFRSALVQGKFFAKRGLWVSEYSIESGINCGGHAFLGKGHLLGVVLEEFRSRWEELLGETHAVYARSLPDAVTFRPERPLPVRLTAAGGIGTAEEHRLLMATYGVESVGWGTPLLLVPEATNVDEETLRKLADAAEKDVYLSGASPLGVPFWNLRNSASELRRERRIAEGHPGSPCPCGYGRIHNTEFTQEPLCIADRRYVEKKLQATESSPLPEEKKGWEKWRTLAKSCICHDLSGGAVLRYGLEKEADPAVCCGPNIVNFSRVASLQEMVDHIYGRANLLARPERPHAFLREISLYAEHLKGQMEEFRKGMADYTPTTMRELQDNLAEGIEYYRKMAEELGGAGKERFLEELRAQKEALERLFASLPGEQGLQPV